MHVQIWQHFFSVSKCVFFFTYWSCLSLPLLQNEKPLGHSASRSSNISKVSKAHTNGKIWMNDVWPSLYHRERKEREQKTGGRQWGELWRKAEIDRTDRYAVEWEQLIDNLPLSHHIAPIRAASLINLQRTDVSLHLSSSAQSGSLSDWQTYFPCDSCLSVISPFFPPSPPHRSLGRSYSLHRIWLQRFNPCSPEPLIG